MTWKSNRREMPVGVRKNARIEDLNAEPVETAKDAIHAAGNALRGICAGTAGRGDEQTDWRATVQTGDLEKWTQLTVEVEEN